MKKPAPRTLLFALSASLLGAFIFRPAPAQLFENKGNWEAYKRNRSIFGLTAGETPMKEVFAALGDAELSRPEDSHDLSYACYKSLDETTFIIFGTNYLHDSTTLYTFAVSAKPPEAGKVKCVASSRLKRRPQTMDGIGLQSAKSDMLARLGEASSEKQNELVWEYRYYEKYEKPRIGYSEAGPAEARYLLKKTIRGGFHSPQITARLADNKVVYFEVGAYGEGDFSLERLPLDKK